MPSRDTKYLRRFGGCLRKQAHANAIHANFEIHALVENIRIVLSFRRHSGLRLFSSDAFFCTYLYVRSAQNT